MPLYDCVLLLKPHITKEAVMELAARIGKHVYARNGVLTDMKSFGSLNLGYGIKKLDGRYFQMPVPKFKVGNEDLSFQRVRGCLRHIGFYKRCNENVCIMDMSVFSFW
ncbi:30S ribosomal protein S6 [Bienertia sinuspersici]